MNNTPHIKLTVVVLVYNTAEFLHQCFDSILNQTLADIEIIAVDDESPDNSLEICREYEALYDNFRVITQKNQGGAVAGTRGMKEAQGKYVALVDSDDFLPLDAYEILYTRAEEVHADISIGKPLRYLNNQYLEVLLPEEQAVWEEERVITSYKEIKTLFHDKFYWNKIFRRDFVERNSIYMPAGFLYADFLMTHKSYQFAKTIAITNKVTYFWRRDTSIRVIKSASQEIASCDNFKERTRSLLFQDSKDKSISFREEDLKLLLLSFVFNTIVSQITFRKTFLEETKKVLAKVDNIAQHDIHPYVKLRLWLIKNNYLNELFYIIGKSPKITIMIKNRKLYCNLPFFNNDELNIPKELFEYKRIRTEMIKNFLYIDRGEYFSMQVLLHGISLLEKKEYFIFFKDKIGETLYKYKLKGIGDYFSCDVSKKDILDIKIRLYVGIGNSDNIVFRIKPFNCEPDFDLNKKFTYITRFSKNEKELFFQKRDLRDTIKRKLKKFL
ncbi:MAG TPA: glycosyltransferase [Arcobacter sp.]|nr:glycosyltransferase [Arcobacter sp.]